LEVTITTGKYNYWSNKEMKVQVKVSPKVIVEAEGTTQTTIFEQLASMQEVFGQFGQCGKCKSDELQFIVREDDKKHKYYEILCRKCFAKFGFGQKSDGGALFPRRKETENQSVMQGQLEAGAKLPDGGWTRYNLQTKKSE